MRSSGCPGTPPIASELGSEVFTRYVLPELPVLYRVARSLTDQPADAEDLVQDTVVRAFRASARFDGANPRAWLLTILRNTNRNRHRGRSVELFGDPSDAERMIGDQRSAEESVVGDVFAPAVQQAFRELPPDLRILLHLVDIEGMTYAEAAAALEIPIGTVMSRLHRARTRIRHRLCGREVTRKRRKSPAESRDGEQDSVGGPTAAEPPRIATVLAELDRS